MEIANTTDTMLTLPIKGMKCQKCVAHAEEALKNTEGVSQVTVRLESACGTVSFDSSICSAEKIKEAVRNTGYDVSTGAETESVTLHVSGMMCMKCVAHTDEALRSVAGVSVVLTNLKTGIVHIVADPSLCSISDIKNAVENAGYRVGNCSRSVTRTFSVSGMKCPKCAAHCDEAVRSLEGVHDVKVDLEGKSITVAYDESLCTADDISAAVSAAGYQLMNESAQDKIITETFAIKGMVCSNCTMHVKKAILNLNGISDVSPDIKSASVTVTYDSSKCSPKAIRDAVSEAGYVMPEQASGASSDNCSCESSSSDEQPESASCTAESPVTSKSASDASSKSKSDAAADVTCSVPVIGMSCAACAARVDKTINAVNGVSTASVNFAASTVLISYDSKQCSINDIQQAVRDAGYDLITEDKEQAKEKADKIRRAHYDHMRHSCIGAWVLSVPIMVGSMAFSDNVSVQYAVWIASTISVFFFGRDFFINAFRQLRHMSFNMDTLVAMSTGIAYLFSVFNLLFPEFWAAHGITPHLYFETSSCLVAFILLGRTLEARAKRRTSASIERLIGLRPKRVTVIRDGEEKMMPISLVQKGDVILVHNGERVALDGKVDEGQTYIDESMLSGEPVPVFKKKGDDVFSGTMNTGEAFKFRAEKVGDDTVLAQIIKMVEEAQGSRAPIQNVVDKIAGIFVPTILIISALTFCIWYFFAPTEGFSHGLLTMMTVLVIACPCALGLATPTAIMVGIGRGADAGVLIKDAESLQTARKIDTVVLDKTGTLTEGHPEVVAKFWDDDMLKVDEILSALEHQSDHPLAQAVVRDLKDIRPAKVTDVENIPGVGVSGTIDGVRYYVGSEKHIIDAGIEVSPLMRQQADKWLSESHTLVWLANEKRALSIVALNDKLKETSAEAVSRLHSMGIDVCLLTGDNQRSAEVVAKKVGITDVKAGVLPQDKAAYIKELRQKGRCVAMVGDGINDSAALANADLSIAMGHGSDVAIDAAGVTILSSDLVKISEMIRLSQATMRILHQNLFWALIYNSICIPVAAGVLYPFFGILLHPMIGGAAMAFSSVSVVTNSLRLARVRLSK